MPGYQPAPNAQFNTPMAGYQQMPTQTVITQKEDTGLRVFTLLISLVLAVVPFFELFSMRVFGSFSYFGFLDSVTELDEILLKAHLGFTEKLAQELRDWSSFFSAAAFPLFLGYLIIIIMMFFAFSDAPKKRKRFWDGTRVALFFLFIFNLMNIIFFLGSNSMVNDKLPIKIDLFEINPFYYILTAVNFAFFIVSVRQFSWYKKNVPNR